MDSNTIYLVLNYECREPETRMAERFWYTIQMERAERQNK